MLKSRTTAALAVALTTAAGAAYAATGNENDALAIAKAKISLSQAVQAAEQHANGHASRAEYENTKDGWVYDVEVVEEQKVFDVTIDAQNGSVLASRQDGADHDDKADHID